MVAWRWVIGDWNSVPQRELTLASNRQMTFTLTAPATATFNLPGRSDEAQAIDPTMSDLWVYADTALVYRGRIVNTTDTVTADAHTVAVDVVDYRGLLTRRLLDDDDPLNWSNPTYADIAWGLIGVTQAKPAGGLGIVKGIWNPDPAQPPSGYRVRNYQAGLEIGKAVDDLASVAFDYGIDAALRMNLWAPAKAVPSPFVADYGGTVVGFTVAETASSWANVVRVSGDATQTVGRIVWNDRPEGRFEQQVGYPDVVLQSTIDQRAAADATSWLSRRVTLNMDLRPGVVNSTADVDVGEQITVSLRDGRTNIFGTFVIATVAIALDDTGVTHVKLGALTQ